MGVSSFGSPNGLRDSSITTATDETAYATNGKEIVAQALAEDDRPEGIFKAVPQDFFDLVIVDECHRGGAREDSAWRAILTLALSCARTDDSHYLVDQLVRQLDP